MIVSLPPLNVKLRLAAEMVSMMCDVSSRSVKWIVANPSIEKDAAVVGPITNVVDRSGRAVDQMNAVASRTESGNSSPSLPH